MNAQIRKSAARVTWFTEAIRHIGGTISAAMIIFGLIYAAWAEFFADGFQARARDWVGVTALDARLAFIEETRAPPVVVEWDESKSRQSGACTSERCVYILAGSRTAYGDTCGRPIEAQAFVRTSGDTFQIAYDGFEPVELSRVPTTFSVPLAIPDYVPPGDHFWRTRVVYPHCPGFNEPIPRWTPWFPLSVSQR